MRLLMSHSIYKRKDESAGAREGATDPVTILAALTVLLVATTW